MELALVGLNGLEVLARFSAACGGLLTASLSEMLR